MKRRRRNLRVEPLERRELLAADLIGGLVELPTAHEMPSLLPLSIAEGESGGNSISDSGGFEGSQQTLQLAGNGGGLLRYEYEHFVIPDNFIIRYEGQNLFETGFTGGSRSGEVQVPAGNSDQVQVIVATNDTGTAWNYTVSEESCGDTGIFSLNTDGMSFMPTTDQSGNLTCTASGTIYVGLQDGPSSMLRIEGAEASYDTETLTITGGTIYSDLLAVDSPLFQSDLTFSLTNPTATVSEVDRADDFALGGLETDIESLTLRPSGIFLEGGFALPTTSLLLGLTGADLEVDMSGGSALVISDRGIGFGSDVGKTDFPTNKGFSLFDFIGLTRSDAKIQYVYQEAGTRVNQLKIQGKFQINELNFLEVAEDFASKRFSLDLTDNRVADRPGFIKVENGVMDLAGELKITNVPLPFGFELSELYVQLETNNGTLTDVTGGAKVKLPPKTATPFPPQKELLAEVGIEKVGGEWKLDDIVLELDKLNIPVPTTPVFWQRVRGGVKNLAPDMVPTSYTGGLGFSVGPTYDPDLPAWLPFDVPEISLSRIDGNFESNLRFYTGDGSLVFLSEDVLKFEGRITLDLDREIFEIPASMTGFGGLISGNLDVQVDYGNQRGYAAGDVALKFPDSRLFFGLRGKSLAQAAGQLQVSYDGNPANDSMAAWGMVDIPLVGMKTVGLQLFFDGDWRIIGRNNVPVTSSFTVDAGTDYLLMTADWDNDAGRQVPVAVIDPNGQRIEEADFNARGIALVPDLSSGFATTVVVDDPAPGIWDIEVLDTTGLTDIQYSAERELIAPTVNFDSVSVNPDGSVDISLNTDGANQSAAISLFYDSDASGFNGSFIADNLTQTNDTLNYTWEANSVPPGDYWLYAMVEDGNNAPVRIYAGQSVSVGSQADVGIMLADSSIDFVTGEQVEVALTAFNESTTETTTSIQIRFSEGVTFAPDAPVLAGQTGTSFSIDNVALEGANQAGPAMSSLSLVFTPEDSVEAATVDVEINSNRYDPDGSNNGDSLSLAKVEATPSVDLSIEYTDSPASIDLGDTFSYSLVVTNHGSTPATNVVLTEQLPSSLRLRDTTTSQGTTATSGATLTWNLGNLDPGLSATIQITVEALAAGRATTTTAVSSDQADATEINNFAVNAATINATQPTSADLSLTMAVSQTIVQLNDELEITVSIENAGPGVASGIQVAVPLPDGLQFVDFAAVQGSYDSSTGIWDAGNIRDGLIRTLEITTRVTTAQTMNLTAEIVAVNELDPDSTPANQDITEDDFSQANVTTNSATRILTPQSVARPHFIAGDEVPTAIMFETMEDTTLTIMPIGYAIFAETVEVRDTTFSRVSRMENGAVVADVRQGEMYSIVFEPQSRDRLFSVRSSAGIQAIGNAPTNLFNPTDTNADGQTSAVDALLVINELSESPSAERGLEEITPRYTDVNFDRQTSALDALLVINQLNSLAALSTLQGEGESGAFPHESLSNDIWSFKEPEEQPAIIDEELIKVLNEPILTHVSAKQTTSLESLAATPRALEEVVDEILSDLEPLMETEVQ